MNTPMPSPDQTLAVIADESFFDTLASRLLEFHASRADAAVAPADLSGILVLTPSTAIGAELRAALARASSTALLLPRFDTMKNWAFRAPLENVPEPFPPSGRVVLLYEALRVRDWFDEAARWEIASEIAALFDELSARSIALPEDEGTFAARLEEAYALDDSPPLMFEARIVYELWKALNLSGALDANLVYQARLTLLARDAEKAPPLFVVLDAAPEEALIPAEREFLRRAAKFRRVGVFHPAPREERATPLLRVLDAAWSRKPDALDASDASNISNASDASNAPLRERARALSRILPQSPLVGRLRILAVEGREAEARAAVAQTGEWLRQGLRRIALIAQDRLTARRVRALLERRRILVKDETGWKLSTSRAAATIDTLLEVAAGNAWYSDVLDLFKSPYVFSDLGEDERAAGVFALETAIRRTSTQNDLLKMRRCAAGVGAPEAKSVALALIDRLTEAVSFVSGGRASLSEWLVRLDKALQVLGALAPFETDAAGRALLKLLEERRVELSANTALFSFGVWRTWLDREMESVNFRDETIESPVVLTPLKAAGLRRFEAALILGGDSRHLAVDARGRFFNDSVRRALGLLTREDEENALRRELEHVLSVVPHVAATWCQDEESGPLAPELALLSILHELAWGDDLREACLASCPEPEVDPDAPVDPAFAAPVAPPDLIPERVSTSACKTLVACPYLFFARHVLGLGEIDEVREEMQKNDYGNFVHRVLEAFHTRHPLVSALEKDEARAALQTCVDEVFDPYITDDFPAIAWKGRWEKRLDAYLDWQRAREAAGWRCARSEVEVGSTLTLDGGKRLELHGRIDRVDTMGPRVGKGLPQGVALLDYKTQKPSRIEEYIDDDVQLALYALMYGEETGKSTTENAGFPKEAAYVALDDEEISTVESGGAAASLEEEVKLQKERLLRVFNALYAGAKLPAHGASRVCAYCEIYGLCRVADHA
ncbi:MAG: PD-(D/E)XK nuclease family protein [Candidatus Accumulibacter sp.]|jgi:ATP-dependent helicase/nuclease subunit B|nr:PD-(D/E)XK nuclease family protein [Accumulibacter sp.]